jgi:hypothetical protein
MPQCAKYQYCTCTCGTCDPITTGIPVPVPNPRGVHVTYHKITILLEWDGGTTQTAQEKVWHSTTSSKVAKPTNKQGKAKQAVSQGVELQPKLPRKESGFMSHGFPARKVVSLTLQHCSSINQSPPLLNQQQSPQLADSFFLQTFILFLSVKSLERPYRPGFP